MCYIINSLLLHCVGEDSIEQEKFRYLDLGTHMINKNIILLFANFKRMRDPLVIYPLGDSYYECMIHGTHNNVSHVEQIKIKYLLKN